MAHMWTTKAGEKMRIRDMRDSHLVNAINLLRRTAGKRLHHERTLFLFLPPPSADGALQAFEREEAILLDMTPGDLLADFDPYLWLLSELARRTRLNKFNIESSTDEFTVEIHGTAFIIVEVE